MSHARKNISATHRLPALIAFALSILSCATSALAYTAGYYTQTSKLSKDTWIKIKIKDSGVYEISYDQLREWGFNNPEAVHVYGMGGTMLTSNRFESTLPDDIQLNYTIHEGSKLYFYGSGDIVAAPTVSGSVVTRRNSYSSDTFYLLSDREINETEIPATNAHLENTGTAPLSSHMALVYKEDEVQNPGRGGAVFVGHDITVDKPLDIVFDVRDMNPGNTSWTKATAHFAFAASSKQQTTMRVELPSEIDPTTVTPTLTAAASNAYKEVKYRTGSSRYDFGATMPDGSYTFRANNPNNGATFLAMDYAWLSYPRRNRLGNESQVVMNFPGATRSANFAVEAPKGARMFNASNPTRITEFETTYDNATGVMTATFDNNYSTADLPACRVALFDPARPQKAVEYIGVQPNTNFHGMATPTMVIITTRELIAQAEELANAHRRIDGITVEVVVHDQLFNEFSGGTPDAMGYRRFIKMLYDRDPAKLKYLLFYGPAHWDNRGITEPMPGMMLSYQTTNPNNVANTTKNFVSDNYFGSLSDTYNPVLFATATVDIAVGRIPATSSALAEQANRKIIHYMQSMPSATTFDNVIIMSDDGDSNSHILQAEQIIYSMSVDEAMTPTRAHNLIYQWENNDAKDLRNVTTAALKRGAGYFVYVGHAVPESFAAESLWSKAAVNSTEYAVPPLAMLSTCDAYGFDRADNGITESMIFKENGGMIGIVGASRTVYGHYNQYLALKISENYALAKPGTTIGEIWQKSFNDVINSSNGNDLRSNTLCYNLCGDPAVRIPAPGYEIKVTEINGTAAPTDETTFDMNPLEPASFAGIIVDAEGNTVTDFNGTVTLILFDAPYTVQTMPRRYSDLNDPILDITLNHDILTTKTVNVVNGTFSATIVAPIPVHEGGINRLTLHADGTEGQRANGLYNNILLTTPLEAGTELPGNDPIIEALAVNDFDTPDGALVDGDVSIVAKGCFDVVGLNNSSAIGAGSTLIIDGTRHISGAKEAIVVDTDNNWTLSTNIGDIDDGNHYATLTIVDNAGRRVSRNVSFTVVKAAKDVELTTDTETANETIVFNLSHTFESEPECRLIIEDRLGNTVLSQQGVTFPYTWKFAGEGVAKPVADGHYTAYVIIKNDGQYGSSIRIPFVIVK